MSIQISVIGLGQIGASIGLALKEHTDIVSRTGFDRNPEIARQAERLGAFDRITTSLASAIRGADLVILSLPIDQIRETLQVVAMNMKAGSVVMDTGPVKETVTTWVNELLPQDRYYIGLTPVINPAYLHTPESGVEAARADLFNAGLMAIVTPPNTSSDAVNIAGDLTRILGASALFIDPLEIDSLMASTHLLPQLIAAALTNATTDQPSWREGRKVAGRAYAEATGPIAHLGDAHSLRTAVFLNRDNVLRQLDSVIAALNALRHNIEQENAEALEAQLTRARQNRERWINEREAADWSALENPPAMEMPRSKGILSRLAGIQRKPKSDRERSGND
jgi:prephenate dehydrogenase